MTWNIPNHAYTVGATVQGVVNADCNGAVKWTLYDSSGNPIKPGSGTGQFNNKGAQVMFTWVAGQSPIPVGTYRLSVSFSNGHHIVIKQTASDFSVVTSGSAVPIAAMFGGALILAFLVVARLGREEQRA